MGEGGEERRREEKRDKIDVCRKKIRKSFWP
jgi:hypothetical protein